MLNSIGIPMAGLAPPTSGGAATGIEEPAGAGGFAALLAAASQPEAPAVQADSLPGIDVTCPLDGAPVGDGTVAEAEMPVVAAAPLALEPSLDQVLMSSFGRPDRSSEAAGDASSLPEVESEPPTLDGSSLATILVQLATPPIQVPATASATVVGITPVSLGGVNTAEQTSPIEMPSVGPAVAREPVAAGPPETPAATAEQFNKLVQAAAPQDRSTIARTLNREGSRFEGVQPSNPEQAATPATPAQATDDAPPAPSTGNAPIEAFDGVDSERAELASRPDLEATRGSDDAPAAVVARVETNGAQAVQGSANQRPADAPVHLSQPRELHLEARDPAVLTQGLADSVHAAVRNGEDTIRLVLNPPDLGHLDIRVTSGSDGVRVAVLASSPEATDLIRQHLPGLVSALEARDMRVDRTEVRQASRAELGADVATDLGSRQPGQRGGDNQPQWARPDWSGVAALDRASDRPTVPRSEQASTRLLDLVA